LRCIARRISRSVARTNDAHQETPMGDAYPKARLAAVQAAPVWLDRDATAA
jgi:hypothetical protein